MSNTTPLPRTIFYGDQTIEGATTPLPRVMYQTVGVPQSTNENVEDPLGIMFHNGDVMIYHSGDVVSFHFFFEADLDKAFGFPRTIYFGEV